MKAKILIVDDSSLARRMLRQLLEDLGHEVEDAEGGEQALERFFLKPPDLVILDLVMNGMYGLDVLAKMREMDPAVKVMIATADIQQSTIEQAQASGAKGLLTKPVGREKLNTAINVILSGGETWN